MKNIVPSGYPRGNYFIVIFLLLFYCSSIAQTNNTSTRFEIEADPTAYFLKGHSVHLGITHKHWRHSIGTFGLKQPGFIVSNDDFNVRSFGFDIKTDYLFNSASSGWHTGIQAGYGRERISLKTAPDSHTDWNFNLGIRAGYRFMFGKKNNDSKGLYLNPWIALIYTPGADEVVLQNKTYKQSKIFPFPAIHLGWRF